MTHLTIFLKIERIKKIMVRGQVSVGESPVKVLPRVRATEFCVCKVNAHTQSAINHRILQKISQVVWLWTANSGVLVVWTKRLILLSLSSHGELNYPPHSRFRPML